MIGLFYIVRCVVRSHYGTSYNPNAKKRELLMVNSIFKCNNLRFDSFRTVSVFTGQSVLSYFYPVPN